MKKFLTAILVSFLALSIPVSALGTPRPNTVGQCIAKGNLDFILFLKASTLKDGFYESIIEPWEDVLMRNKCQSSDIMSLTNQQDKVRSQIRDAFLTCNTQKIPNLKIAFNKYNMEIYYVRHVVDGKVIASLPYELLSTRMLENPNKLIYPKEKLYAEMVDKYVTPNLISKKDFDQFFNLIETKYKDRKNTYISCENDSFDRVSQKFKEFINTIGGITPAWDFANKQIGGAAEKLREAVADLSIKSFISGLVQFNFNKLPYKAGFEEISRNINKYIPGVSTNAPTQSTMLQALTSADKTYELAKERTAIATDFEATYKETSDFTVELLANELKDFNKTLQDSFPAMDTLLTCSKVMESRQCPNKTY